MYLTLVSTPGFRICGVGCGAAVKVTRRGREAQMAKTATSGGEANGARSAALKIGEVAKRSGVGIDTLRFYEKRGLLGRPARTESGYRLYSREVLEQIEFIKRAQALGFSLDEIARVMSESRTGHAPCKHVREVVRLRLAALDEELATLRRYRDELAKTLERWESTGDVPGHICGLIEGSEMHAEPPGRRAVGRRK
jgi:MerR family Zn(II)-responsive transcriptional regulator of zntA